jgi:electron transfer flavoprotein beta subunit
MEILVCVKRVPATGGRITLTPDGQEIDTRFLGFTISPAMIAAQAAGA